MNRSGAVRIILSISLLVTVTVLSAGETTRVSVSSSGEQANEHSDSCAVRADGRFVAFTSSASNLVLNDTNLMPDIFVRDRLSGQTSRISVSSSGEQSNSFSSRPSISADGRFVTFESYADNLVLNDTNGTYDIFIRDRLDGQTSRVSISSSGAEANSNPYGSRTPVVNADGRFVAFTSLASNLVPSDTNGWEDIFVRDRLSGQTRLISVSSAGEQGNGASNDPAINADGRFVVFTSSASNLVPNDTNGVPDIFVRNHLGGQISRINISSSDEQANSSNKYSVVSISADGRYVAFSSSASNLVSNDTNGREDIFVRDRLSGQTSRVSVSSSNEQGNDESFGPVLSADGRFVTFTSLANNLISNDTNGTYDVFIHDQWNHRTVRVSVNGAEQQANNASLYQAASADGRFVAFTSYASRLVPNDTNGASDIFVRHRLDNTSSSADLQVVVTAQPASVQKGAIASYTVTLTNAGPDIAHAVSLIDVIGRGSANSFISSQGRCSKAAVTVCHLGSINPGGSVTVTAKIRASRDQLIQQLSVNTKTPDLILSNNYTEVSTPVTP